MRARARATHARGGRARLRYALRPAARVDARSTHRARTRSDLAPGARLSSPWHGLLGRVDRSMGRRMGRRRLRASGILPRPFMLHIPQLFCL